jgi:hypothetical protein
MVEIFPAPFDIHTCGAREPGRPNVLRGSSCTLIAPSSERTACEL